MIIPKPINYQLNPPGYEASRGDIVRLFFEQEQARDFYVRGSVCWPEGKQQGFCIVAGQTLDDKQVWLFDQFEFRTVEHWFNDDQSLRQRGLCYFLQNSWAKYGCRVFFIYSQNAELVRRFLVQIIKSQMVMPKPELIPTPYTDDDKISDNVIEEYLILQKLKGDKNTTLYSQLSSPNIDQYPGPYALKALLAGYEAFPYMQRGG